DVSRDRTFPPSFARKNGPSVVKSQLDRQQSCGARTWSSPASEKVFPRARVSDRHGNLRRHRRATDCPPADRKAVARDADQENWREFRALHAVRLLWSLEETAKAQPALRTELSIFHSRCRCPPTVLSLFVP